MRVLHLLSSTGFYGAEAMAAELVRQLAKLGQQCHVGVLSNRGRGDQQIIDVTREAASGTTVIDCRWQYDPVAVREIAAYVATHEIQIVHSHKEKTTFHSLLARRRNSFKLVSTHHNWLTDTWNLRFYGAIDKRLAAFCDARVGVSQAVVRELARFGPSQRLHYVGNGVDPDLLWASTSREAAKSALGLRSSPVVGFVGRLSRPKGLHFLLDALSQVEEATQLIVVGDGEERGALEERVRTLGLSSRVHFFGRRRDIRPFYSAMDLCVLPSLVEAFPMVLLEAMACAVPTLATNVGDVSRIVDQDVTGWVVTPGSTIELARVLKDALAKPQQLLAMGERARERVIQHFSSRRMAERYLEIYRSVLA